MPIANEFKIAATDGYSLAASIFEPPKRRPISVLINSATGVPRGYYERFACFLTESGFRVITYDYRGMYGSKTLAIKDDPSRMRDWGQKDLAAVLAWLHARSPQEKIVSIGHSIGGTLMGLAPNNDLITTAINVATPTAYWRYWSGMRKYERLLEWYLLLPLLVSAIGYLPARFAGGALPKGVALEWAHWGRHRQFVVDEEGNPMHDGFLRFKRPLLFLSFSDDSFAPPRAVDAMRALYRNASIKHEVITPSDWAMPSLGHFAFFRKNAPKAAWLRLTDWIEENAFL